MAEGPLVEGGEEPSRREFLASASAAVGGLAMTGAGVGGSLAQASAVRVGPLDLGRVVPALFEPLVGSAFGAEGEGLSRVELELIEVTKLDGYSPGRSEPFSLVFRGPSTPPLPQGIFTLTHDSIGSLGLLLVPVGPGRDGKGPRYQAIFN